MGQSLVDTLPLGPVPWDFSMAGPWVTAEGVELSRPVAKVLSPSQLPRDCFVITYLIYS